MEDWDPGSRCGSSSRMSMSEYNLNLEEALSESRKWIEAVTGKLFKYNDYRKSVSDGVLFCELMQHIKRGSIRKINRLPTTFAGMDNLNVFLKTCEKEFGLNGSQLFHAGDLQDLSHRASFTIPERKKEEERRLKNVCITLYWLGKKARQSESFVGPHLNLDVFTTLLFDGSSSLKDTSSSGVSSMDSGDPTNNNRFSFGACDEVFGPDGTIDFSNIAPKSYKEPEWKRGLSIDVSQEAEVTVQAVEIQETSIQSETTSTVVTSAVETQYIDTKDSVLSKGVQRRSRMERRMKAPSLKPHMRSQSVPEQMLGYGDDDEGDGEVWMSSLSSWKNRRMRATSTERSRKALQEEVQEIESGQMVRRKSKTYKEIIEEKEKREKELQEIWANEHGTEPMPTEKEREDRQQLEKIMTDEPLGYASDGEQNNNEGVKNSKGKVRPRTLPKSFKQKKVRPTILKPEPVTATSAPRDEQSPPARAPSDPHKQKLRRRYGSAFQPYLRSSPTNGTDEDTVDTVDAIVPQTADNQYSSAPPSRPNRYSMPAMSFHDKLVKERELDHEMAEERRDIHSKTKEMNTSRKGKLSSGIMSRVMAFDRGEADVPKETKPQAQMMRQRSMSRPFSELTVCINQRPRSPRGFGFTVEGGIDQDKPIVVTHVESDSEEDERVTTVLGSKGGPADSSELRVKDEIVAINGEKVKPFTYDDFMYEYSQAVLSGSLSLKVRRYDDEEPENQSSDPAEVISPSRARAMFSQMEQKQTRSMSPDSQRSMSPKHTPSPPKAQENHKPHELAPSPPENTVKKENDVDHSMPYKDIERPVEPPDEEHSPSTSPFSSADENEDRDKSWLKPSQTHHDEDNSKITPNVESKVEPPPVSGGDNDDVVEGRAPKIDDTEWLKNLEEIEKEAFGFIEAQGRKDDTEDRTDAKSKPEEIERRPEDNLHMIPSEERRPNDNHHISSGEEERMEDEIMDRLQKEEKDEQVLEDRHRAIEQDELDKSAIKESPIERIESQPVESSLPSQPLSQPDITTIIPPQRSISPEPRQPLFKVTPAPVPIGNLGPKPYKPMAPEPFKRPAQPVFLREKDIREKVKADMHKRRSDFFSKSLPTTKSTPVFGKKVDMSPCSSGRSSPVDEPVNKSMEELWQRVEQPQTESQPQPPTLRHDSRPRSLHGFPSRKPFNLEEERKRLEKWQADQERLRQEKYEQEQKRLQEQREQSFKKAEEEEKKRLEAEQRAIQERQKKLQQLAEERLRLAREEEESHRLDQERLEEERRERGRLEQERLEEEQRERDRIEQERLEEERQQLQRLEALQAAQRYHEEPVDVEEVIQPQRKQAEFSMPREDPHAAWQREQEELARQERERRERQQEEEVRRQEQEHQRLQKEHEEKERKAREMELARQQKIQETEQQRLLRIRDEEIERIRAEEREKLRLEWEDLQRERALQEEREREEMERLKQLRAEQERLRQERMLLERQQAEERHQLELEKERLRKLAAQPMSFGGNKPQSARLPQDELKAPVEHPTPYQGNGYHGDGAGDASSNSKSNSPLLQHSKPAKSPDLTHVSKFRDPNSPPQQHWLVEEAERRRLADKTGAGRVSPFVNPKDNIINEPSIEKNTYQPEESAPPSQPSDYNGRDPKYPMDPPTRIAPPRDVQGGGDYEVPSRPYESQPIVRRPRRKEADIAELERKKQNRRSLPDLTGNGDVARTVGGELTPPLGQGSAPPPEAIMQVPASESHQPAYYEYAVTTQVVSTRVVNTQGMRMVAPIPYSAAYATYNWETAPQEPMLEYDQNDYTARNATAATQDTNSLRYDSDGNEML